jgi:hypothetical protein
LPVPKFNNVALHWISVPDLDWARIQVRSAVPDLNLGLRFKVGKHDPLLEGWRLFLELKRSTVFVDSILDLDPGSVFNRYGTVLIEWLVFSYSIYLTSKNRR